MNQKRKIGKRIAAWFMCLVMVLSIVNLPGFTMTAHAAEYPTTVTGKVNIPMDEVVYCVGVDETSTGKAEIVSGKMPDGLRYEIDDYDGAVRFVGTPKESGTFYVDFYTEEFDHGHLYQAGFSRTIVIKPAGPELIDRLEINYTLNNNKPNCTEGELYKELRGRLEYAQYSNGAGTKVAYSYPSIETMYLYSYTGPERSGTQKQLKYSDTNLIDPNLNYYLRLKISAKDGYDFKHDGMKFDEESATFIVNGVERTDLYFGQYNSGYKYVDVYIPIELDLSSKVYSITITNKETNVEKASTLQLTTDIIYYGNGLDAVEWTVEGATSKDTAVDDTGLLTIGDDEKSDSITVKATAAADSSVFAVKTFGVTGALSIESVTIDKLYENVNLGSSVNFLATVEGSDLHDVIWTLTGNTNSYTTITQDGKKCTLKVARDEGATELILKVTSVKDPSKFATSTITVLPDTFIDRLAIDYTTSKATAGATEGELYKELRDRLKYMEYSNGAGTKVAYSYPSIETMYLYSYTGPERSGTQKQLKNSDTNLIDPNLNYYLRLIISAKAGYDFKHDGMEFDEESATFIVNGVERTDLYFGHYNSSYKYVDVYIPIHTSEYHNYVDGICTVCGICKSVSETGKHVFSSECDAICNACGYERIALGIHDFSDQPYLPTEDGTQHYQICKDCGAKSAPLAHGDTEVKNVKAATCTEKGYTGDKCCKDCGVVIEVGAEVNAKGHTEVVIPAKEATCKEIGLTEGKKCSVCGTVTVAQTEVKKLEHTWDAGKVTKEPTKDADGIKTYTCTKCGETKVEVIDKLPDDIKPSPSPSPDPTPSPDPDKPTPDPTPVPSPEPVKPLVPEISVKGKFDVAAAVKTVSDKKPVAYAITTGNKKAGKITKSGIFTAKKAGEVEITAYADKKKKEEITTVKLVIKATKVPAKDTISFMDDTCDLKSKITNLPLGIEVKFSISEKQQKIAIVDAKTGIITPVKDGKAKVTVEIGEGKNAAKFYTTITVKTPKFSSSKPIVIKTGNSKPLALKNVKSGDKITWSVSDDTIAKVIEGSKVGKIKVEGLKAGKVTLTADINGHKIAKEIEITE